MDDATNFAADGAENGFPHWFRSESSGEELIPRKMDVSAHARHMTLGGVNGTTATDEQIQLSLIRAMNLFWNFNSVSSSSLDLDLTLDFDLELYDNILFANDDWDVVKPSGLYTNEPKKPHERVPYSYFSADIGDFPPTPGTFITLYLEIRVVEMYYGVTTNPDNLIGYGVEGENHFPRISPPFLVREEGAEEASRFSLRSYLEDDRDFGGSNKFADGDLDGYPFVLVAEGPGDEEAFIDVTSGSPACHFQFFGDDVVNTDIEFSGLNFYPYNTPVPPP